MSHGRAGFEYLTRVENIPFNETTTTERYFMNEFLTNLQRQAEANPILALGVGAGLITAISKLLDASVGAKNAKSWELETKRRAMKDAMKK